MRMEDSDQDGASASAASSSSSSSSWSWEENKRFELALAAVDERSPDRWAEIASMVGREKSAEDARRRYEALLEDLCIIESGALDYEYVACLGVGESLCWNQQWFDPLSLSS
ncbi:protein RADIALIS-like 4 [Ananas comosus]|uniref:Protein RADIALIS-like 4 n=1 Tax=Ananas comosus TaxID=4615 RepID=A0A6P5G9H9_ANACO|nr:protein RADIALIS-like 4 [Ananas comosus]